jgi:hypothetical protein
MFELAAAVHHASCACKQHQHVLLVKQSVTHSCCWQRGGGWGVRPALIIKGTAPHHQLKAMEQQQEWCCQASLQLWGCDTLCAAINKTGALQDG